jgi:hypothetical protein
MVRVGPDVGAMFVGIRRTPMGRVVLLSGRIGSASRQGASRGGDERWIKCALRCRRARWRGREGA